MSIKINNTLSGSRFENETDEELRALSQNVKKLSSLGSYGTINIYNGLIRVWLHVKGEEKAKEKTFSPILDLEEIRNFNKELEALITGSLNDKDVAPKGVAA